MHSRRRRTQTHTQDFALANTLCTHATPTDELSLVDTDSRMAAGGQSGRTQRFCVHAHRGACRALGKMELWQQADDRSGGGRVGVRMGGLQATNAVPRCHFLGGRTHKFCGCRTGHHCDSLQRRNNDRVCMRLQGWTSSASFLSAGTAILINGDASCPSMASVTIQHGPPITTAGGCASEKRTETRTRRTVRCQTLCSRM